MSMYKEYKLKLPEKPNNKWNKYEINMPLSLVTEIAQRVWVRIIL